MDFKAWIIKNADFFKAAGYVFTGTLTAAGVIIKVIPAFGVWIFSGSMDIMISDAVNKSFKEQIPTQVEIVAEVFDAKYEYFTRVVGSKVDSIAYKVSESVRGEIIIQVDKEMRSELLIFLDEWYKNNKDLQIAEMERIWVQVSKGFYGETLYYKRVRVEKDADGNPSFITERIYTVEEYDQLKSDGKLK